MRCTSLEIKSLTIRTFSFGCGATFRQHNHPIEMNSNEMIDSRLDYIHENPVVAGFVDEASDWRYSSAKDYAGGKGLIDLIFLD